MRRIALLFLFAALPVLAQAQDLQAASRHYLASIKVPAAEITKIMNIQQRSQRTRKEAQLELNVLQAELAKALFPIKVDMNQVRKLLNESLQWKMKAELAAIQQRVEVRRLLGDVKYADYRHFLSNERSKRYRRVNRNRNAPRG